MNALQRAVPISTQEIIVHREHGQQVFGQGAPLAAGPQDIENPVHHLPHIHLAQVYRPFAPAALGRRDQRRDQRLLGIAQFARISKTLELVETTVLTRSHWPPPEKPIGAHNRFTNDSNESNSFHTGSKTFFASISRPSVPLNADGGWPITHRRISWIPLAASKCLGPKIQALMYFLVTGSYIAPISIQP